ncbi:hypothetical protein MSHOH_1820 [Methanosarcina horonobensis HB-1 = JCM 15518]|uniref:DUF2769 domain-containing protein n=1 Tax=Methanosarcina horonobensis HB-1 = JCM 15518 TaxID=1434110 RepID=A0A0E3SFM0_9EURY|nr:DUF2769 domain-containing protein [Methanosarcina horonobensis]AKB78303.1 hypothetical protein MSHOH_1820 [Methanosarcina horonobensis HB-1 = JCM 15518]
MEGTTHTLPITKQEEIVTQMCICPDCPSWIEGGERGGFCFETIPKSRYISEEKGCICSSCPVANRVGFSDSYYCTREPEEK